MPQLPAWLVQLGLFGCNTSFHKPLVIPGRGKGMCHPRGKAVSSLSLSTSKLDAAVPETQQSSLNFGTEVQPVVERG